MTEKIPGDARRKLGRETRSAVLGAAHVARSDAKRSAFNADFLDFITEGAWGSVWSRPGLTKRERSLITLALLAALGHHEELAMHVRATANTGASAEDIKEALLHVAVYAGVPAANQAFKIAEETLNDMGRDNAAADEESRS
ncbi:MAG: 4-carboxymuconolactone decarboxylase [Bacteroidota bacterium]|nr:4-carboxymuconolactone decarboxylase [Kiloniellaceae bacterium]